MWKKTELDGVNRLKGLFLGFERVLKQSSRTFFKIDTYDDQWLVALEEQGQSTQSENGQTTPYGLLMVYNKTLNTWRCVYRLIS